MIALFFSGVTNSMASTDNEPPEVVNKVLSTSTIAYQGNTVPGYVTITLDTNEPTRGYILAVRDDGRQTKINLNDFKTKHVVSWVPWDDQKREPLPPGTYHLKSYLSDASYNSAQGFPIGQITIVNEPNPKALVDLLSISNASISPKYASDETLTTFTYNLSRPAEVQIAIQKNGVDYFQTTKMKLDLGKYNFDWNGKNEKSGLLKDGEYDIVFKTIELAYNYPATSQTIQKIGNITISNGEGQIPQWRLEEIISDASFDSKTLNSDGTVSGNFTIAEPAKATVYISTAAGSHMNHVYSTSQELQPGTYSFTWNGKDMMNSKALNGTYYIKISVTEGSGSHGYITLGDPVTISNHRSILPLDPEKQVKVITEKTQMKVYPMDQGYIAVKNELLSLISESVDDGYYNVLVKGVPGKVKISDVELVDSAPDTAPTTPLNPKVTTTYTVVSGDTLWKIAQKHNTTINDIIELNQLDLNKSLMIGQVLQLPVTKDLLESGNIIHVVQSGDMLWKIAHMYGVTVNAILLANNLSDLDYLRIGQKLIIPAGQPKEETRQDIYVVKSGDTLWKIAQTNGVTVNDLVHANQLDSGSYLSIGQTLVIPVQQSAYKTYTVQPGDTLWKIAQANQVTIQQLVDWNQLNVDTPIHVGQQLKVLTL